VAAPLAQDPDIHLGLVAAVGDEVLFGDPEPCGNTGYGFGVGRLGDLDVRRHVSPISSCER